ncbi:hypothetical protein AYI68_g7872 [Smittium mucronatum]|uniref:Uncharacterized protein n=1 Tax=Smittium mucronatum TaxID=133383 RepID=A0A1R0GMH8_9FUNG|nr:hypothetical protein AYI68_g7872 [Smittium mucronatum]
MFSEFGYLYHFRGLLYVSLLALASVVSYHAYLFFVNRKTLVSTLSSHFSSSDTEQFLPTLGTQPLVLDGNHLSHRFLSYFSLEKLLPSSSCTLCNSSPSYPTLSSVGMVYPKPLPSVPVDKYRPSRLVKSPNSVSNRKPLGLKSFILSIKSKFRTNYKTNKKSLFKSSKYIKSSPFIDLYSRRLVKSSSLDAFFESIGPAKSNKPRNSISVGWLHENESISLEFDSCDSAPDSFPFPSKDDSPAPSKSVPHISTLYTYVPPRRTINDVQQQLIFNIYNKYYPS